MKTRYIYWAIAAMVAFAACEKEAQQEVEQQPVRTVLQVGIADTKTYLGDADAQHHRKVYWSNGDQIAVNGTASDALDGLAANTASADFNFTGALSTPYNVLYPASIYTDATHVTLPAIQTYKEGGIADNMLPLAGYSADGSNISLTHLCAVVKVSVKRKVGDPVDTDNIVAVRFKGKNSEKVSGSFEIAYNPAALTATIGTGDDLEVRVVKSLATSTSEAIVYYLVVPARTYSNGFDVIVQDVKGDIMTKSKASSIELVAGKLYNLAEFAFVPNGTATGIEITSAEDLIAFATAYNNKEYGDDLVATITADITFDATTSAAFNATGGIGLKNGVHGTEDYYFKGVFNGNSENYSISGLEATVPLFTATDSDGIIKNLTLDNTCSFEFTHANTTEGMFGSVVGYHKGTLDNVKVAADISLAAVADVTQMTTLGGLAGRTTVGKLQNGCEYSGLISTPAGFTSNKKVIIGGLVGRFSNAGSISDCFFKGAISNAAQVTSTDKTNPYLIIGGVVGHLDGGASVSSTNTTDDHEAVASAHASLSAIIVNKTTVAYHSAVGGIAGEVVNGTVSNCTNAATIGNSIFRDGDGTGRYMKSGGIVGRNGANGVITGCTNNGTVIHRSNPRLQSLGGIAGYNAGQMTNCTNNASVSHMATGQSIAAGRVVSLGGVIGENIANNMVSDVHNTANMEVSSMEDGTSSEASLGGVIGNNTGEIDGGVGKNITNTAQVYFSPYFEYQFLGYNLGGIVGKTSASVRNVLNTGNVYFRWNSEENNASKIYLGGVVGKVTGENAVTISGCENRKTSGTEGQVYLRPGKGNANYLGGILGYTDATAAVTVSNCTNGGTIAYRFNYTVSALDVSSGCGGIVGGQATGTSVSITGCTNNGEVYHNIMNGTNTESQNDGAYKNTYVGGIMAKGTGVTISNCTNNGYVHGGNATRHNSYPNYVGGIVAHLTGASSIQDCSNTGNVFNADNNNTDTYGNTPCSGGLAAFVEGTSGSRITIGGSTGCTVDATEVRATRGWVAGAVACAKYVDISSVTVVKPITVSACHYAGGIAGYASYCSISSSEFSGNQLHCNTAVDYGIGGIAASMDNSMVDGCNSYLTTATKSGGNVAGGAIVGISGSENTIQNCHYKATINSTTANIAGTGTFTDGGGNVADL